MANKITTFFSFQEEGNGLKRIAKDVKEADGAINKLKVGFKSSAAEFRKSNAMQAGAIAGFAAAAFKATEAASALGESQNAVNTTFQEGAEGVAELGKNSVEAYGLSERAFNQLAVGFAGFAKTVAGDGGDVVGTIDKMATRVADFASTHDLSMEEASTKFRAALAGEAEAMRQYSVDISAANVKTYAYANGIADAGDELDEQQKVLARYGLIMQQTELWADDFANTSDSLANQQRKAQGEWENASATLGETLAPALATVVGGLNEMLQVLDELKVLDAVSLSWVEDLGTTLGEVLSPWNRGDREKNREIVRVFEEAEAAAKSFDKTLLEGIDNYDDAKKVVDEYTESIEDEAVAHDAGIQIIADWGKAKREAAEETEAAERALEEERQALRDNAREATYTADAHEELGRIQEINTSRTDRARDAMRRFMESIKFTRDEVGALKREIDDEQAWLSLNDAMDATIARLEDGEASARDQRSAIVDLKEEVIDYAEQINLPQRVVTKLVADIDAGKVNEVRMLLAQWGNGVTIPLKPVVINTGSGTSVRVDENGNVRANGYNADGTRYWQGGLSVVGENGPELVNLPRGSQVFSNGESRRMVESAGGGSTGGSSLAPVYNINVTAGLGASGDDIGQAVVDAIRKFERHNGNGWRQ